MIDAVVAIVRYSAPVGLAALGETVGQRAGLINIGLEGTMLTSSYVAMVATKATNSPWIGLLCGCLTGLVLALVQAFFTLRLASDQVVVGTAVNLLAIGLTGTLYRAQFGASGQLLSIERLPRIAAGIDLVLIAWPVLLGLVTWALFRTRWGLLQRAVGENPDAVMASGTSPVRARLQGALVGGLFAGLAGAYLAVGIAGSFAENMTAGRGFVALAMVTFGRWKPIWVALASLLIGYADSLQFELQARGIGLPPQLFIALPYVLALAVLVAVGRGTTVPEALGKPLQKTH